ncbi:MAG: hypothetical protein ACRC37_01630 [Lentisphaeria bacterium]
MKTFNIYLTVRNEKGYRIETKQAGEVTAYTFSQAMRKGAKAFNEGNWADISVIPVNKKNEALIK